MRECCRQVEAEVVSNSRSKFSKPGNGLIMKSCSVFDVHEMHEVDKEMSLASKQN